MFEEITLLANNMPMFAPNCITDEIQKIFGSYEQSFKQPIKKTFGYPVDIKKVYDKETNKFKKLVFEFALAGIKKENISAKLVKGKHLTLVVKIEPPEAEPLSGAIDESNEYEEIITKSISHRASELAISIYFDVDIKKFKESCRPEYKDGILTIALYPNENNHNEIDAIIE